MKKEKLYAPLMLSTLNDETRPQYLELLKEADVDYLFIALFHYGRKRAIFRAPKIPLSELWRNFF